jgi:predicted transcriptional regulator
MNKALLLSVRAEFAQKIFAGEKTIELRRRRPQVEFGDYIVIYVPSPKRCIMGVASVDEVLEARVPTLWRKVRLSCGLSYGEYRRYFTNLSTGFGIRLSRPAMLTSPLTLDMLREIQPSFTPQGYKYLSRTDLADALGRLRPVRFSE